MKSTAKRSGKSSATLPEPGRKKKNPRELDELLDKGVEDSMAVSDPPAVTQPEVHTEPDRGASNVETAGKQAGKNKI